MRKAYLLATLAFAALGLATSVLANTPASSVDLAFKQLYSTEWAWRIQQYQEVSDDSAVQLTPHLPDVSAVTQGAQLVYWNDVEARLKTIDVTQLSAENQVNYAVYKVQIEALIAAQQFREYEKPFNSDSSFWGDLAYMADDNLHSEQD